MNYIQIFAKGGKATVGEMVKWIQQTLGVDDNQMQELWQIGINKYGSEEGIEDALNESLKGLNETSSPDEIKAAVANVFSDNSMFKCGGKLQQLAAKFAKGGKAGCGCHQDGGTFKDLPSAIYNENGMFVGYDNEPNVINKIQSGYNRPRTWTFHHPSLIAKINNTTNQSKMLWNPESLPEYRYGLETLTVYPDSDIPNQSNVQKPSIREWNGVEKGQEGGELSRKDMFAQAKENRDFTKGITRLAYANAKNGLRNNSDLRGKALRQAARRMVVGEPVVEEPVAREPIGELKPITVTVPGLATTTLPTKLAGPTTFGMTQEGLDNMSFKDAFARARKEGKGRFIWNDKVYTTELAKPTPQNEPVVKTETKSETTLENKPEIPSVTMFDPENRLWNPVTGFTPSERFGNTPLPEEKKNTIGNNWFVNATLNAQANELPVSNAVMTASGLHRDRNGNWYQEQSEEDKKLAKNLAIIGASGVAGTGMNALLTNIPAAETVWNPAQARTGTFFSRASNGAIRNNATGQFIPNTGMNMGQFASGTDYAATMANNLRMFTPVGFKYGGKMKKKEIGGKIAKSLKCGGKTKKK